MALGATVVGASNVLTLSTRGPVRVRPAADRGVRPAQLAVIVAGRLGSTLVTAIQTVPAESLAAIASTRGRVTTPWVYVPASKVVGKDVASWNGTYILKTW